MSATSTPTKWSRFGRAPQLGHQVGLDSFRKDVLKDALQYLDIIDIILISNIRDTI